MRHARTQENRPARPFERDAALTETNIRALDAVADVAAFRDETDAALAQLVGRGNIINYFDDPSTRGSQ